MSNVDKRIPICGIFMDMTQAFDHVVHDVLLYKLELYGIRGNVLKLIETYLKNRTQFTQINRINSRTKMEETFLSGGREIQYGVPQGGVLSSLLFIIYINDLPNANSNPMTLFADDSTVAIKCNDRTSYEHDINSSLNAIIQWLDSNNLKANIGKTKIMHFSQRINAGTPKINYKGEHVAEVLLTKFLGLTLDNKLNWKSQIETLCKRLNKSVYALHELRKVSNINTLLAAYHGLVASVLRYGVIFWGNSTDIDIIFKAQKRCLRAMFGLQMVETCKPFFQEYKILTLPSLYIYEVSLFVKTNKNIFKLASEINNRQQRDALRLYVPRTCTSLMYKSVFHMAPVIFNKLPKEIRAMNTALFKKSLKKILANKCYYNLNDFLNDNFAKL